MNRNRYAVLYRALAAIGVNPREDICPIITQDTYLSAYSLDARTDARLLENASYLAELTDREGWPMTVQRGLADVLCLTDLPLENATGNVA